MNTTSQTGGQDSHFGVQDRLSLRLEVGHDDTQLTCVFDELFELGLQVAQAAGHDDGNERQVLHVDRLC